MSPSETAGTKARIAREALRLFVEKGIAETTIRDITAAVGVTEGALYRHYESKEALAWELFSSNFVAFATRMDAVRREHGELCTRLDIMIRMFCAFFDEDPVLFSFLLLAQHSEARKVTPEMPHPVTIMRACIEEGMRRREIPEADPDLATAVVLGIVLQAATFKVYGRLERDLGEVAPELVRACWRALGA